MRVVILLFSLILISATRIIAQDIDHEDHFHGHHHEHHHHELGIANNLVYFLNEKEFAYGLHVHYIYNFKETIFGVGLGYERIFDEHGHNSIGVIGSITPVEGLNISLSPGIGFEDRDPSEIHFTLHFETSYEFEVGDFHLGPTIECAYDPEDVHLSLGLHMGYGF